MACDAFSKTKDYLVSHDVVNNKLQAPGDNLSKVEDYITNLTNLAKKKYGVDMGRLFKIVHSTKSAIDENDIYLKPSKIKITLEPNTAAFEAIDRSQQLNLYKAQDEANKKILADKAKLQEDAAQTNREANVQLDEEGNVIVPGDEKRQINKITEAETAEQVNDMLRQHYLNSLSDVSLNLASGDFWLNHPWLADATTQDLINFAKKINPDFNLAIIKDLDQKAVSLIRDHVIMLKGREYIDQLPEEVAHFYVALLPKDGEIYKEMMKNIINFPIYSATYQKYKNDENYQYNGKPNTDKIKEEAVAKLIGEYIEAASKDRADEKYGAKRGWLRKIIDRIFKWLRKNFYRQSKRIWSEPTVNLNSVYRDAADRILRGDVSDLDLKQEPDFYEYVYYSKDGEPKTAETFHSKVEENTPESFEATKLAKSAYTQARAIRQELIRSFYKFLEDKDMKGLKERLQDPQYQNSSRVWMLIEQIRDAQSDFDDIMESGNLASLRDLSDAAMKVAESFHIMEEIPKAVEIILNQLESQLKKDIKENTLSEGFLLDNVREIQKYRQFSDTFLDISKKFDELLSDIKEGEKNLSSQFPYFQGVSERMIDRMGSSALKFKLMDEQVIKLAQNYILHLFDFWTNEMFTKYRKEIEEQASKTKFTRNWKELMKREKEQITDVTQLKAVLFGEIPQEVMERAPDGTFVKWDQKKLKDISNADYLTFMLGSPTYMADPFLSNATAFYIDKKYQEYFSSVEDQRSLISKIDPILQTLHSLGLGYYEAQQAIQHVQERFDVLDKTGRFKIRTFLSHVDSIRANTDASEKYKKIEDTRDRIYLLKDNYVTSEDEAKKAAMAKEIAELEPKLVQYRNEYNEFMDKEFHRPYTDEFINKRKEFFKTSPDDSKTFKELKTLERSIQKFEGDLYKVMGTLAPFDEWRDISMRLGQMYEQRIALLDKLPKREKDDFKAYNEMYETDPVAQERAVAMHRSVWVQGMNMLLAKTRGSDVFSKEDEKRSELLYDKFFTLNIPTEEFWNAQGQILDEIKNIQNSENPVSTAMSSRLEKLSAERASLLKGARYTRQEVSMAAIRFAQKDGELVYKRLADIEDEMDRLRRKITMAGSVYGQFDDNVVKGLLAAADISYAIPSVFSRLDKISNQEIKDTFGKDYNLSDSDAVNIRQLFQKMIDDKDESEFEKIKQLLSSRVANDHSKFAMDNFVNGASIIDLFDKEDNLYRIFSKFLDSEKRSALSEKWEEFNDLRSNLVSWDYITGPLTEMREIARNILAMPDNTDFDTTMLQNKLNFLDTQGIVEDRDSLQQFLGDGFFEEIIKYLEKMATDLDDPNFTETSDFLKGIHTVKKIYGTDDVSHVPYSYMFKPLPNNPDYIHKDVPAFLRRNKIKDEFTTPKIDRLHPDVLSGKTFPTVDMNGKWLPRPDSSYKNSQYDSMKAGKDAKSKALSDLHNALLTSYLQFQKDFLPEGMRPDVVMPSRHIDHFENTKLHLKGASEWIKNFQERINMTTPQNSTSAENINYNEEIGILTKESRDIYSGIKIANNAVKLESLRRIPIQRVSQDAFANIAYFIEDVHDYNAKNIVDPIFKSMVDIFTKVYNETGMSKQRLQAIKNFRDVKILNEVPKNWANNPMLAKVLQVIAKISVRRLYGDPLGAIINLSSGEVQQLIETAYTKTEMVNYFKSGALANAWTAKWMNDIFKRDKLSKETQLSLLFAFVPERMELANRMSKTSMLFNMKSAFMAPRSSTEIYMGIHNGLSMLPHYAVTLNGKYYTVPDMYQLDKNGNLELIPEFANNTEMFAKYNPKTGITVTKIRKYVIQKYLAIQGNYYKETQDYLSTNAVGRLMELMKRYLYQGLIRRLDGPRLDAMLEEERVGFHWAMLRVLGEILGTINPFDKERSRASFNDFWQNGRTKGEKEALRRSIGEMAQLLLISLFTTMVLGYDSNDKDKNQKLHEMGYWKQVFLLMTLRLTGEMGTYIPLPMWGLGFNEIWRGLMDPFATSKQTVLNMAAMATLLTSTVQYWLGDNTGNQIFYQKNSGYWFKQKGMPKIYAVMLNLMGMNGYTLEPEQYIKTYTQLQNKLK